MDASQLRELFPVTRSWAFLDHAGVSAASAPAARAFAEYSADVLANGATCIGHWVDRCEQVRRRIAGMLHADPRGVALVKNTTEGLDFVAEGFPWNIGDNVVLPADEYPSNQYPWMNLASSRVEVRRVPPRGNRVEIADLRDAMDARTRVLAVSWVGFGSGFRLDLHALVDSCRARNVKLCVDAIQGFAALPLRLDETPIDFIACGSHKWGLGFQGAGFFYLKPELLDFLRPGGVGALSVVGGFNFSQIDFTLKPDAGRFEGGTQNMAGIAAWGASLELIDNLGLENVAERIQYLTDYVCENAGRAGLTVFSDRTAWSGIVALDAAGSDPQALKKRCREAGVAVNCRGGHLRVAPHCYNNTDDLDRFLDAVAP